MNIPGFTAEGSMYRRPHCRMTDQTERAEVRPTFGDEQTIVAQWAVLYSRPPSCTETCHWEQYPGDGDYHVVCTHRCPLRAVLIPRRR
jgi:hypothetical protein